MKNEIQGLTEPWNLVADKLEEYISSAEHFAAAADADSGTPEAVENFRVALAEYEGFTLAAYWFAESEGEKELLGKFLQRERALSACWGKHVDGYRPWL